MNPSAPQVLTVIGSVLRSRVLPEVQDPFAQGTINGAAGLLGMIAAEFDRAAARLVEENAAQRCIFAAATDVVAEPALLARLQAEAEEQPQADLHVSALQRENDGLRALLIDLHAQVETLDGEPARALEERIWQELAASTVRRKLSR